MTIRFDVAGEPVTQGSMRRGRNGKMFHDNAALMPWRSLVTYSAVRAVRAAAGYDRDVWQSPDTPIHVAAAFRLSRPKSVRRLCPTRRYDLDKLARALLDAITDARVWADDGQTVELSVSKRYVADGEQPGVSVAMRVVGVAA